MIRWLRSWRKPKLKGPQPVIGRAILKFDGKSKAKYWVTANSNWLDRADLTPNESLGLPVAAFEIGTTIEICGKLTKEAEDTAEKESNG